LRKIKQIHNNKNTKEFISYLKWKKTLFSGILFFKRILQLAIYAIKIFCILSKKIKTKKIQKLLLLKNTYNNSNFGHDGLPMCF